MMSSCEDTESQNFMLVDEYLSNCHAKLEELDGFLGVPFSTVILAIHQPALDQSKISEVHCHQGQLSYCYSV